MKVNKETIQQKEFWNDISVALPQFDCDNMCANTKKKPVWVHFGAGNIFRGFVANLHQKLLNEGLAESGIIAVETFDYDIIDKIYDPFDNLTLLVTLKPDGSTEKEIVASIAEGIKADLGNPDAKKRLVEIFTDKNLQMVSFTITEKGYTLTNIAGDFIQVVAADMQNGPKAARHAMSIVTALLLERFQNGAFPIALVSLDNCSHNGEKVKSAVLTIAKAWVQNGFADAEFVAYLENEQQVSFPWSMIDKITPRPDAQVQESLEANEIEDMAPIITAKNTFIAPFVNAEVSEYLVVEDSFPAGRPALEKAGVYFTDRATVNDTERMKVTTCLNPLHTALAVFGCLLGYKRISDEMSDPDLKLLVEKIGYQEGMPVVTDPKIISPEAFLKEVLEVRLRNPFIPDTPQRIATDTSQKIVVRFGETIKSYINDEKLDVQSLEFIPLVIAAWLRYLLQTDDELNEMPISPEPMFEELSKALSGIEAGKPESYTGQLLPILQNEMLFAVDLTSCGLSEKIEQMFAGMLFGKGAVRATLKKYLKS